MPRFLEIISSFTPIVALEPQTDLTDAKQNHPFVVAAAELATQAQTEIANANPTDKKAHNNLRRAKRIQEDVRNHIVIQRHLIILGRDVTPVTALRLPVRGLDTRGAEFSNGE